jgi:hypothetical protein
MLGGKRIVVVMPAYRAGRTLEATWRDLPHDIVDDLVLVDDFSDDDTVAIARTLGLTVFEHPRNSGYGSNQKTCYAAALDRGADIVVMVHPDYQYDPRLVTPMAGMIASGVYDLVPGSRILGGGALAGGMPWWKYVANRILTAFENLLLGAKLSEYHTGYRAYSRQLHEALPWQANSDDFVFDSQLIAQAIVARYRIGEVSVPTRCFPEASSIDLPRSIRYGIGVVATTFLAALARWNVYAHPLFRAELAARPTPREPPRRPGRTRRRRRRLASHVRPARRHRLHRRGGASRADVRPFEARTARDRGERARLLRRRADAVCAVVLQDIFAEPRPDGGRRALRVRDRRASDREHSASGSAPRGRAFDLGCAGCDDDPADVRELPRLPVVGVPISSDYLTVLRSWSNSTLRSLSLVGGLPTFGLISFASA